MKPAPQAFVVERMSKVDTAWLRMDSPSNLMMILGVWIIRPRVSYAAVCERIGTRLLQYPRFGQRVQQDATGASWITDTEFNIKRHVLRETLAVDASKSPRELLQLRLGELAMQPLDDRRPLWDFRLVERYDGGSALIARFHHCIADGLALVAVMQSLLDGGIDPPERRRRKRATNRLEAAEDWMSHSLIEPLTAVAAPAPAASSALTGTAVSQGA